MTQSQHIMIVDDEAPAREMVGDYLKMHGFTVTLCDGGKSLRAAIQGGMPDLVVLDLNMPEEDGLSIIRDLKSRINVPVIMLTATASPIDRVVGLESRRRRLRGKTLRAARADGAHPLGAAAERAGQGSSAGSCGGKIRQGPAGAVRHQMARPRSPGLARRRRQRASADGVRVRAVKGVRGQSEARAVARAPARVSPTRATPKPSTAPSTCASCASAARSSPIRPSRP